MSLHPEIAAVTDRIIKRSKLTSDAYLALIDSERSGGVDRPILGCANLAHGFAGTEEDRDTLKTDVSEWLKTKATYPLRVSCKEFSNDFLCW